MSHLEKLITAFEEKYLAALRNWCALVPPEDLDKLQIFLDELEVSSRELTQQINDNPILFTQRWQPMLIQIQGMLPTIEGHLAKIATDTRSGLTLLDKGQRSLMGYRQSDPKHKPNRLDSNV